jgi:hypothetical protein|nr:MAG TPA: hypothetical protein [Bacteriophage sp.]
MTDTIDITFKLKDVNKTDEEGAVLQMIKGIRRLVSLGGLKGDPDEFIYNYQVDPSSGYATATIDRDALLDTSYLTSVGAGYSYDDNIPDDPVVIEDKGFSAASIKERVRISGMPIKQRFRYIILDYRRFYTQNRRKILSNRTQAINLRNMFLNDLMAVFNDIMPELKSGKQLIALTGLGTVSKDMATVSKDLSLAYKRSLSQLGSGGQISRVNIQNLQKYYNQFMDALIPQVFPGLVEAISETKTHSDTESGTRLIQFEQPSGSSDILVSILNSIRENLGREDDVKVIVKSGGSTSEFKLTKEDKIENLTQTRVNTAFSYSYCEDGRIKLF